VRIQLILTFILLSFHAVATDDKSMQELFIKYDLLMDHKKTDLIDEVFTTKFIKESGGKKELIKKINDLPTSSEKSAPKSSMTWKKGLKGEIYFAKVKEYSSNKKKGQVNEAEFIVLKEDGKLKVDGTISDGN
jgi:hypothetical protein